MFIPMAIANMPAGNIAIEFGFKGESISVLTACASSTHAIGEAYKTIKLGAEDVIIAGGTEAAICEVGIAGFENMKANKEFYRALEDLEREKNIPKEYMLDKIKAAIASTIKRDKNVPADNVEVIFNEEKENIKVCIKKDIVETVENPQTEISLEEAKQISRRYKLGDVAMLEVDPSAVGRIAAKVGKNVIVQAINEAVNGSVIQAFEERQGSLMSGTVRSVDPKSGTVMVEVNGHELPLFPREQIPGESFEPDDVIRLYVSVGQPNLRRGSTAKEVMLSRTTPKFVEKLFEVEVPEIASGVVEIKGVSREAGSRSKVAVRSNDPNVDAVGSCIGPKRSRINTILEDLAGERIDLIKYSEDPGEFVAAALSPAEVRLLEIDNEQKSCKVVVGADQLSLAIGKTGQNVRLAARLTGYRIDILSE